MYLILYIMCEQRLAKALKWKIYHFLVCFFCASVDVGRFLKTRFRPWIHQPSESFGLTLATETTFNSNFCSKTARYRLFLAVVRCCVTTTLAVETFGLLNVYLNYKFGLGLPRFYLLFSLFKKKTWNDNLAKEARRLKSKKRLDFLSEVYGSEENIKSCQKLFS